MPYRNQTPAAYLALSLMPYASWWTLGALWCGAWWWALNGKRGE